jgi:hypothetical protein
MADNRNIFEKLMPLGIWRDVFGWSPEHYHCVRLEGEIEFRCKKVYNEHRIVSIHPGNQKGGEVESLEAALKAPVKLLK